MAGGAESGHALFEKDAGFVYEFAAKRSEVFFQLGWNAIVARRRAFDLGERRERDEARRCHQVLRAKWTWVAKQAKQKCRARLY